MEVDETPEVQKALKAFRKALKPGDRVRHISDWKAGTVVGKIHVMYETGVRFDDCPDDPSPVNQRSLYPEWWPAPEWAKSKVT